MHRRHDFASLALGAAAVALAQTASFAQAPAGTGAPGARSVPDLSGIWTKPYLGWELPLSGPAPVTNKNRRKQALDIDGRPWPAATAPLVNSASRLIGDYNNPILKPAAAQEVKRLGEQELHGMPNASARNQCWPEGVPAIFRDMTIAMLQQPHQITILYDYDHELRRVRMNQQHPAAVMPTWYGDSVGHYEGDTLVIDTVGIRVIPLTMVDNLGTPQSPAMHVVERYRLLDYAAAREGQTRGLQENFFIGGGGDSGSPLDPDYRGKGLQLAFTIEDDGVFTTPWSATITYRRALGAMVESACAENLRGTYVGKDSAIPQASKPDF
ncbi:MAG TPA: hypothetical protein VGN55_16535 [Xanthobacteraceae bacterium]|jgi:hypothetical protein